MTRRITHAEKNCDETVTARCLSFHSQYLCAHRGRCCTSQWPIPIEADRLLALRTALATGALRTAAGATADPFVEVEEAPKDAPAILATTPAGCVFYRGHGAGRCEVHRAMGHAALPLACRQFPRVVVRDPRGVSVTLSHYCPTAAALVEHVTAPVSIVADTAAFPPSGEYVGLDASTSLPPLLRPGMLMDWEAWWELERLSVRWITESAGTCRGAVDRLAGILTDIRGWQPIDGPLVDRVARAFDTAGGPPMTLAASPGGLDRLTRLRDVAAGIPADWAAQVPRPLCEPFLAAEAACVGDGTRRRYTAAHAFASWTAHLGQGLHTWWRSVDAALLLLEEGLGVDEGDLVLRHLADPDALARIWSRTEEN
jgi:Fe-S-cluster containining protein